MVFYTCTYIFVSLVEAKCFFFRWNCSSDSFVFYSHFKHADQLSGHTKVGNRIQIFGHKSHKIFIETQIWMYCFSWKHKESFFSIWDIMTIHNVSPSALLVSKNKIPIGLEFKFPCIIKDNKWLVIVMDGLCLHDFELHAIWIW